MFYISSLLEFKLVFFPLFFFHLSFYSKIKYRTKPALRLEFGPDSRWFVRTPPRVKFRGELAFLVPGNPPVRMHLLVGPPDGDSLRLKRTHVESGQPFGALMISSRQRIFDSAPQPSLLALSNLIRRTLRKWFVLQFQAGHLSFAFATDRYLAHSLLSRSASISMLSSPTRRPLAIAGCLEPFGLDHDGGFSGLLSSSGWRW